MPRRRGRRRREFNKGSKKSSKVVKLFKAGIPILFFLFIGFTMVEDDYNIQFNFDNNRSEMQNLSEVVDLNFSRDKETVWNETRIERKIHRKINEERTSQGLQKLSYKEELTEVADYHSKDMAQKAYFSHDSPSGETMSDRYAMFNVNCRTKAENIFQTHWHKNVEGVGYIDNTTMLAESVVTGWMNSKGHRENILDPRLSSEAIGVYKSDEDKVYVTQNFC
jgi:uncharacterized protein YkwD